MSKVCPSSRVCPPLGNLVESGFVHPFSSQACPVLFLEQKSFQRVQVVFLSWGLDLELGRGWYRLYQASYFLSVSDLPCTASGHGNGLLLLLQLPRPNCKVDALKWIGRLDWVASSQADHQRNLGSAARLSTWFPCPVCPCQMVPETGNSRGYKA